MVEVGVARSFRARHRLMLAGGSVHEDTHDYRVEAVVRGASLPATGILLDLDVLGAALAACLAELDAADLDALPAFAGRPTTVEIVADHIWHQVREGTAASAPLAALRVTVFESADAWAAVDRAFAEQPLAEPALAEPASRG